MTFCEFTGIVRNTRKLTVCVIDRISRIVCLISHSKNCHWKNCIITVATLQNRMTVNWNKKFIHFDRLNASSNCSLPPPPAYNNNNNSNSSSNSYGENYQSNGGAAGYHDQAGRIYSGVYTASSVDPSVIGTAEGLVSSAAIVAAQPPGYTSVIVDATHQYHHHHHHHVHHPMALATDFPVH